MRFTLVVGCLPGWWVGEDDGRKGGPLLTPAQWESILSETGFAVETISEQLDLEDAWVAMAARVVDEQMATLIRPQVHCGFCRVVRTATPMPASRLASCAISTTRSPTQRYRLWMLAPTLRI